MDDSAPQSAAYHRRNSPRRRGIAVGVAVVAFFFGVFIGRIDRIMPQTAALLNDSLRDAFGIRPESGLIAEIPLAAPIGARAIEDAASRASLEEVAQEVSKTRDDAAPRAKDTRAAAPLAEVAAIKKEIPAEKSAPSNAPLCAISGLGTPSRGVLVNEIAWMGGAENANDEWIELENISGKDAPLDGWQLVDQSGNIAVRFQGGDTVHAGGRYLLERTDDASVPGVLAEKIYAGALPNLGNRLVLFDAQCNPVDDVDAVSGWPAGDNDTKQTMERNAGGAGWHTSGISGGTPKEKNSLGAAGADSSQTDAPASLGSARMFTVAVEKKGDGTGVVRSNPTGIDCGAVCQIARPEGSSVVLSAQPTGSAFFEGWRGVCGGTGTCTVAVRADIVLEAIFMEPGTPSPAPAASLPSGHVLVSEIQITGGSGKTDNDLIRMHNPTGAAVDMSGWKLRKRAQTGAESSIRVFPAGSMIPAGGAFLWANSGDGFAASVGADASSTQTVAAQNSIALFDVSGNEIDAVAWGSGHVNPYGEGAPYPENPGEGQLLRRKSAGGVLQDTGDNAADFSI